MKQNALIWVPSVLFDNLPSLCCADSANRKGMAVQNMDRAERNEVLIKDIEGSRVMHLAMRKTMSSPQTDLFLAGADANLTSETYVEYEIDVSAAALTERELVEMFVD